MKCGKMLLPMRALGSLFIVSIICAVITVQAATSVAIIGGSGTLGRELISYACRPKKRNDVLLNYRPLHITATQRRINKSWLEHECSLSDDCRIDFVKLDLRDVHDSYSLDTVPQSTDILINAAGVCIAGKSRGAMEQSLMVNAQAPLRLAENLLSLREGKASSDGAAAVTVVNVSSGDGELCYLHSSVQDQLSQLQTIDELHLYIKQILLSHSATFEYAFGDTPFYSLSKALLNRGTQLLHSQYCQAPIDRLNSIGSRRRRRRIIAVCPGNFASPMSSAEEMDSALPVETAAASVWEAAERHEKFLSGRFYRHGEEINW